MSALCVSSTTLNSQRVSCNPIDFGVTLKVTLRSVDDCVVVAFGPACAIAAQGVAANISAATVSHPAILTIGDGCTLKPSSWVETVSGGHHREGVLAFDVAAPRPTTIELRIARPGESTPRTFRWQL